MGRRFPKQARFCTPELIFEQLEDRIVLDASLDHAPQDSAHDLNVVLASSARPDLTGIVEAVAGRAELVLYDQQDDLVSLDAKLEDLAQATGRKIGVLAVVEHGAPAELIVGSERIDLSNVDAHRSDFETLARNLADHAQIQFFGCNVAENAAGKALVDRVAAYTSADVFASNDTTGGKTGNWVLEYASAPAMGAMQVFDADALGGVGPLANPQMIADVDTIGNINGVHFVEMNDRVYFNGDDGVHGRELWVYDPGTGAVSLVSDIVPGATGSNPAWLWNHNGILYFSADDGTHGVELWRSNGTAAGTFMVADISSGAGSSDPQMMMSVNGDLFFVADDGVHGVELWKSDGAGAGTSIVADINPGSDTSVPDYLTNVDGTLFFSADDGVHGSELWKSDGTGSGTVMVKDIFPGPVGDNLFPLTNINGTLFFTSADAVHGNELWKSDGTASGTVMVKDIRPGSENSDPLEFCKVNSILFFQADDGVHGMELWRSDGSSAGTVMVKDISPGAAGSYPFSLANVNGTLYFVADDGVHGDELWKSDGTELGTAMVKEISPQQWTHWPQLTAVDSALEFVADDGIHGLELWGSDGTNPGTVMVNDINAGAGDSYPVFLTTINGTLYFSATDGTHGYQVWRYDPPPVAGNFSVNAAQGSAALVDGWNFTDPNGDQAQSIKITALPTHGTLFRDADHDNVIDGGEAVTANQVITWADAKTSPMVKYRPTTGYLGADALQYVVTDTTGAVGTVAGTANVTVVDAVNDPPVNTVPGAQTVPEDSALIFSTGNGNAISISDPDAGAADVLVQLTGTNGAISLALTNGLHFSAGDGASDATMTFTGTTSAINAALNGMRFVPSADYNGLGGGVTILTNDLGNTGSGGAKVDIDTILVTVSPVQDPPVPGNFAFSVDAGTVATLDGWNFTDPDGDQAQSVTVTVLPTHGTLFLDANTDDVIDPGETINAGEAITWADASTAPLVKYTPAPGYAGFDSLHYRVTDTSGTVSVGVATVSITVADPFNDPPVNDVPAGQTTIQNDPLIFSTADGNAISISDPDAGTADVQVQLSAENGTITLGSMSGLSFVTGDGTADATMTFTGPIDAINTALDGMTFTPTLNYAGSGAIVSIVTDDLGNTGGDGPKTDTDTVTVTVTASADLPQAGDFTVVVNSSTATWPSVGWILGWNFTDAQNDAADSVRIVSLPTHGTLFLDANGNQQLDAGETITAGQDIPWATLKTFQGVKYIGDVGYNGLDSFTYVVIDDIGDVGTFQGTCTLGVGPNHPPVQTVPGTQSMQQGTTLSFRPENGNEISVTDPDVGFSPLEVTVYSYQGTLSLGTTANVSILTGDGTDDWAVRFRGPVEAVNTALDGLSFTPLAHYYGPAAVVILTSDLGATGVGGYGLDMDVIPVTIVKTTA
jgi:ELWxxDGT repeat protein